MLQQPQEALTLLQAELSRSLAQVRAGELQALQGAVLGAPAVFVTGEGRSGLVARSFAMRLAHLGLRAYVVGETATPAFRPGDLLVAVSGSGSTASTCLHASSAAAQGGKVAAVTGEGSSPLAKVSQLALLVPSQASEQFGGSLFEQAALLLLDAVSLSLQGRLGQSDEQVRARHATLE